MLADWFIVPELYLIIICCFPASRATKLNHLILSPHLMFPTILTDYSTLFIFPMNSLAHISATVITFCVIFAWFKSALTCSVTKFAKKFVHFFLFLIQITRSHRFPLSCHLKHRLYWVAVPAQCSPLGIFFGNTLIAS